VIMCVRVFHVLQACWNQIKQHQTSWVSNAYEGEGIVKCECIMHFLSGLSVY